MLSLKTPVRFLEAVLLDFISIPGKFMSNKGNAEWHLQYVCPHCSQHRKKFRDPNYKGNYCIWEDVWKKGKINFPRDFGPANWLRYYLGLETDLQKFERESADLFK